MKWDDWDDLDFNNMAHELEVHIITTDGAQHLRLSGYLKRNSILIKCSKVVHKVYPPREECC